MIIDNIFEKNDSVFQFIMSWTEQGGMRRKIIIFLHK